MEPNINVRVETLKRRDIKPGDVLVVRCDRDIPEEARRSIGRWMGALSNETGVKCFLLPFGFDLEICGESVVPAGAIPAAEVAQ